MKTQLRNIRREGAFTYLTVVITMIVVGLMLAAYLKLVSVQNQLTMRSQVWNRSVPVLEAGIEEAIAHLNKNGSPDAAGTWDPHMTADGWILDADLGWHKQGTIGDDAYYVKIAPWPIATIPTNFPSISSTGYVKQAEAFAWNRPVGPFVAALLDTLVRQGRYSSRVVQATTTNLPTFTRGLVAKHVIDLNGRNVMTDSYDSSLPAYNTNGRYDATKARDHGDIGSNDTIINSVNVGNAIIKGNVSTGPLGTVAIGSSGVVGDAAYTSDPANQGTIQTGHVRDDLNVEFPNVELPTNSLGWLPLPAPYPGGYTVDGVTYKYLLTAGNYYVSPADGDITSKSYYIEAPGTNVQIRVDSGINLTGTDVIRIGTNSTLKIFANCPSVNLGGNGVINPGLAQNFYLFGTSLCKNIDLGGNAEFTGVIYAPYADLNMNGSGSGVNDFSGAAMVNSAKFNGNFRFHFDEALPKRGLWHGFVLTSWNER